MASFGYHEIGRLLLDQCAEVNKSDEHGETPLHIAVFMGKVEMVRLLLEHNADVNNADNLVKFNYQRIVIKDSFTESKSVFSFTSGNRDKPHYTWQPMHPLSGKMLKFVVILT